MKAVSYTIENGAVITDPTRIQLYRDNRTSPTCLIATLNPEQKYAYIFRLYVHPDDRGDRHAGNMLDELIEDCTALGIDHIKTAIYADDPVDQEHTINYALQNGFELSNPARNEFTLYLNQESNNHIIIN